MANILILNVPRVDVGLTTSTYTVPTGGAGIYRVDVQATEVPVSGLSIVVNQNGSPKYTTPVITPTQIAQQFKTNLLLAGDDVVTIVATGSGNDLLLNSVKINTSIGQGE